MKKVFMLLVILVLTVVSVFAVDISIGGSLGLGFPVLRGDDYDSMKEGLASSYGKEPSISQFTIAPQFDAMFEFNDYFALETGFGYENSKKSLKIKDSGITSIISANSNSIQIPLIARGQIKYDLDWGFINKGITFFGLGFDLGIGFGDYLVTKISGGTQNIEIVTAERLNFIADFVITLGQEFQFAENHYFGVRFNADIALDNPVKKDLGNGIDPAKNDIRQDDIIFGFTYRYAL